MTRPRPAEDDIRRRVRRLLATQLDAAADALPADDASRLDETMGLDSSATIAVVVAIEEEFGIAVDESDDVGSFRSVDGIVRFVESRRG